MAPFLSFTAEEAWAVFAPAPASTEAPQAAARTIFTETFWDFGGQAAQGLTARVSGPTEQEQTLLARWVRIRAIRDAVNKEIEVKRSAGLVGSSLQADAFVEAPRTELAVDIKAEQSDFALLQSLGDDLKYVFMTSEVGLTPSNPGEQLRVVIGRAWRDKCARCWHYPKYESQNHVGVDPAHPTICGRCVSNLYGAGEVRTVA
jgi:isoleucyl-tRNA synthetase